MRDPARIEPAINALREAWYRYPDWRLGQVIANASREAGHSADPFHVEDDVMTETLREMARRSE